MAPIRNWRNNCLKGNVHDKYAPHQGPTEVRFNVIALHWENGIVIIKLRALVKIVLFFPFKKNSKVPSYL